MKVCFVQLDYSPQSNRTLFFFYARWGGGKAHFLYIWFARNGILIPGACISKNWTRHHEYWKWNNYLAFTAHLQVKVIDTERFLKMSKPTLKGRKHRGGGVTVRAYPLGPERMGREVGAAFFLGRYLSDFSFRSDSGVDTQSDLFAISTKINLT